MADLPKVVDVVENGRSAVSAETCADTAANIETLRDFEGFLRRHGFSRRRAKAIAMHGFNAKATDAAAVLRGLAKVLDGKNVSV